MTVEAWLRGPVESVPPLLMPVAHALLQAREDLRHAASGLSPGQLWDRPGGAASVGFHLQHIAGSIDRLLTYARGEQLSPEQLAAVRAEVDEGGARLPVTELLVELDHALDNAMRVVAGTRDSELLSAREVGRARLPSTVLGLLFHVAEHTQRHTGQTITTSRIVRAKSRTGS